MPDIIRRVSNIYNKRLHDFEDDTHAEVVAARIIGGGQTDGLTNEQLRATPVATTALTDTQLRYSAVRVDGGDVQLAYSQFTRPADTTAYAIGDAITNSTTEPTLRTFGGLYRDWKNTGLIVAARLVKNSTTTANASFRLWIWPSTPSINPNDNAALQILWDDWIRIGYIDFPTAVAGHNCTDSVGIMENNAVMPYVVQMIGETPALVGILQARAAYVPTSGERFAITLSVMRD